MIVICNNSIPIEKWKSFFNNSSFATPFQSPEYYDFFNSVNGLAADVFAVEENNELQALCVVTFLKGKGIKSFFSRRAIIYGGPLVAEGEKGKLALNALILRINKEFKHKVIYAETRNFNDYINYKYCFTENGWNYEPYLNYHLDCTSKTNVWKNFNTNRKRQIKKAIELGVQLGEAKSWEEVDSFYEILRKLYHSKIKKPLPPYNFFTLFFEKKLGKYLLVKYEGKVIGGIMSPLIDGKSIYELYICGLDHEYKAVSPSVMATYAAIEYGLKNGFQRFDFMGAGKPSEEYGVRDFKAKFGGELVEHGRFIKVYNPFLFNMGKLGLSILKKI